MSDSDLHFSNLAYAKMVLHVAKYPHAAVNGLLLSNKKEGGGGGGENQRGVVVVDAVPLFHQAPGLSPMMEVALAQVEAAAAASGLALCGLYHANELFRDTAVDAFNQKVADKLAENVGDGVVLATVDNKRLGVNADAHALVVSQNVDGKWRSRERSSIVLGEGALDSVSSALSAGLQAELADFDNHLDDVAADYLNAGLNDRLA